jgi:hypothetical protein
MSSSRREFIKRTAFAAESLRTAALAAQYAKSANTLPPQPDISVWFTLAHCLRRQAPQRKYGSSITITFSGAG